jgi:hypothetical protein
LSKNRDAHSGSHHDRRRLHLNRVREKEHREEERKFKEMGLMQQKLTFADASQIKADMAKLAARITIVESSLADIEVGASPRSGVSPISVVALIVSVATLALLIWAKV